MNEDKNIPKKQAIEKLIPLISSLLKDTNKYIQNIEILLNEIENSSSNNVVYEIKEFLNILKKANKKIELANNKLKENSISKKVDTSETVKIPKISNQVKETFSIKFKPIGIIHTPYTNKAPYQPVNEDEGDFRIIVDPQYSKGLYKLERFRYIYVIYYLHKVRKELSMIVSPSWANGVKVGLFASRSPVRPNPIGISVVRIKEIKNNEIVTSGLDVLDGTPLLDIKPYIKELDSKTDANYGWLEDLNNKEHLLLHIKGIPHDY